jgi:hypothetical protein
VIAAKREGRLDALVRDTTAALRAAPADTSRLALLTYATLAGATVEGDPMEGWARRLLTTTLPPPSLLDAAEAAMALGRWDLVAALIHRINVARASSGGDDDVLRRLVLLAALDPTNLPAQPELRVDVDWIDASKEGQTLAALCASRRPAKDIVAAWKPAWERVHGAAFAWEARNFAWPWAGWCLRAGDLATAKEALTFIGDDDDAVPPSWAFAAAIPPLADWRQPETAADVAAFLSGQIRAEDASRRGDLIRLAVVLAGRLEAAGKKAEAEALRRDLRSAADGVRLGTFTP